MTPSSIATSFHHFPSLPLELRLQIWNEAALYPRVIRLRDVGECKVPLVGSVCPLLVVCREARFEVLKRPGRTREGNEKGVRLFCELERDVVWLEECDAPFVAVCIHALHALGFLCLCHNLSRSQTVAKLSRTILIRGI